MISQTQIRKFQEHNKKKMSHHLKKHNQKQVEDRKNLIMFIIHIYVRVL